VGPGLRRGSEQYWLASRATLFPLSLLDHPIDIFGAQAGPDHKAAPPCRALVSQLSGSIMTVIMRSFGRRRRFAVKLDGGDR
jgi:hypothetical protein